MGFRKAKREDIRAVAEIYDAVHEAEAGGELTIGWMAGVYPIKATAEAAIDRDDLYVYEEDGNILATAIINQVQVDCYAGAKWQYIVDDDEVMVLHTLVVHPEASGRGIGTSFVRYYEECAKEHHAPYLRIDTNARNARARDMYRKLGYAEVDIVPTTFNGIPGVNLVLLEKNICV